MAKRVEPIMSVLLYSKGAEPYFGPSSDCGYSWYSVLANEAQFGSFSYATAYAVAGVGLTAPTIEYIGTERMRTGNRHLAHNVPVGLVLKPFIVPKDISGFSLMAGDAGQWETARSYSSPPVFRVLQENPGVDSSGNTTYSPWGITILNTHPANASFALSMLPLSVAPEYQETIGGISFVEAGWSDRMWAIRMYHNGNPILFKRDENGNMIPVMELGSPGRGSHADNPEEIVFIVRVQRGRILISSDYGASYDVWMEPDGSAVSMPAGRFTLMGQGCCASLGIHQVVYVNGSYVSPTMPMERQRAGTPTVLATNGANSTGTSLAVVSVAPVNSSFMQYEANLGAGMVSGSAFNWYFSPELYSVEIDFPVQPSIAVPFHDGGATFDMRIMSATVDYPRELSESTFTVDAKWFVSEGGPPGSFAMRMVKVFGGWVYDDGSNDVQIMFTGYITNSDVVQQDAYSVTVRFVAQSVALRPKRMQWRDSNASPYDGLTPNQALLKWAISMGLNFLSVLPDISGRGDNVQLPALFPEEPSFMPTPGEPRWGIMEDIARYSRMELGCTKDGLYAIVPNDRWNMTTNTWDANPILAPGAFSGIEQLHYEQRILDTFTGVLARGRTFLDEQIAAWVFDGEAETDILSDRFRPWPEWHVETVDRPTTQAWLAQTALGLAYEKITPINEITVKGELAQFLGRRDTVMVNGSYVNAFALTMMMGVTCLTHHFDKKQTFQAWTEMTGRRLV